MRSSQIFPKICAASFCAMELHGSITFALPPPESSGWSHFPSLKSVSAKICQAAPSWKPRHMQRSCHKPAATWESYGRSGHLIGKSPNFSRAMGNYDPTQWGSRPWSWLVALDMATAFNIFTCTICQKVSGATMVEGAMSSLSVEKRHSQCPAIDHLWKCWPTVARPDKTRGKRVIRFIRYPEFQKNTAKMGYRTCGLLWISLAKFAPFHDFPCLILQVYIFMFPPPGGP